MTTSKKKTLFPFFALVLLLVAIIAPVSADLTFHFIDRSYMGNNPVTITDHNGTSFFNGTTNSIAVIPSNFTASYWISFEPGGITDIARSPDFGAAESFSFAERFGIGILIVCFVLVVIFWRKNR